MEIPVYESETRVGTLLVFVQGLYTVFEARLEGEGGGLSRLWLGGGAGAFASLGLLESGRGERRLRRRFSRLELQKLPPKPWTALVLPTEEGPSWREPAEPTLAAAREQASTPGIREERAACSGEVCQGTKGEPSRAPGPAAKTEAPPPNSELRTPHSESPWLRLSDGSLCDPERGLLALPWAGGDAPAAARILRLAGREYWVFRA